MSIATVRKAVIPAGGLGTRLLPATKVVPKELVPLIDVPVIQLAVEEAQQSGITDTLVITGRGKGLVEDHFDRQPELEETLAARGKTAELGAVQQVGRGMQMHYTRQGEPLGLGHAVLTARGHVDGEPFAVLLPDDVMRGPEPILAQLLKHWTPGLSIVALLRVPREQAPRYGVATGSMTHGVLHVDTLVEKPRADDAPDPAWAVMGRYILDPDVFRILDETAPGAGGEIQLTDALAVLAAEGRLQGVPYQGERYDVGDKMSYVKAIIDYGLYREEFRDGLRAYLRELLDRGVL